MTVMVASPDIGYRGITMPTPGATDLGEKVRSVIQSLTANTWKEDRQYRVLNELVLLNDECSYDDWDGYGAPAIKGEALTAALEFVNSLSLDIPAPELCPEADGDIAIEWVGTEKAIISISVGEGPVINYSAIFPDQNKVCGTESVYAKDKGIIETYIKRVLGQ